MKEQELIKLKSLLKEYSGNDKIIKIMSEVIDKLLDAKKSIAKLKPFFIGSDDWKDGCLEDLVKLERIVKAYKEWIKDIS
jgi:hypothetical protein